MDTTRKYRSAQFFQSLPRLDKDFVDYKYYGNLREGRDLLEFIPNPIKSKRRYQPYKHAGRPTRYTGDTDIYSTPTSTQIQTDENGRPYVSIRYDPSRTKTTYADIPINERKTDGKSKWFLRDTLGFGGGAASVFDTPIGT